MSRWWRWAWQRWLGHVSLWLPLALLAPLAMPSGYFPLVPVSSAHFVPGAPAGLVQVQPAPMVFELDPRASEVNFTLGATMHTVHGTFHALRGRAQYTVATGAVEGEFVVDAASGSSGDASRDLKMNKEILESEKYPTITFRPDRAEGKLAPDGESTVQVHGVFNVHGVDHELMIPVRLVMGNRWTARAKFTVPYVDWGMKNPSTFLLKVSKTVDIEIVAIGDVRGR